MKPGPLTFNTGPDLDKYRHEKKGVKMIKSIFGTNIFGDEIKQKKNGALAKRFEFPPFSIFNAREGLWQDRKRAWLSLGIQSEIGRGGNLLKFSEQAAIGVGGKKAPPKSYQNQDKPLTYGQESLNKIMGQKSLGGTPGNTQATDSSYYPQKTKKEKELGKELTNEEFIDKYYKPKKERSKQKNFVDGVLMTSDSGNDPRYYAKKQEKERELGRELTTEEFQNDYYEGPDSYSSGTSIFDPVLCELMYTWFCPKGGMILDPFAGGSVRGIVAGYLGYSYYGIDLSERQIEANIIQKQDIIPEANITWIVGDAMEKLDDAPEADCVIACPPYGFLERYSDDPKDLSTMTYPQFIKAYRRIIFKCSEKLKEGGMAIFIVGDFRDPKTGSYVGFVPDTVKAFQACGMSLYNEAILITAIGSLPIRIGKQFSSTRKLGKTHQNVLGFIKGSFNKLTTEE